MTIGTNFRNDYIGTAVDTYNFTFKVFAATDLRVTTRDNNGAETDLAYPTDFTVTGVGNASGGTITLTAGDLTAGYSLSIRRVRPVTQTTDIRNQSAVFNDVLEDTYDHLVMIDQQQQDELNRSLKILETEAAIGTIPAVFQRSSKFLAFDVNGDPVASAGTGADIGLRADLAASGGAGLVSFLQTGTGTAARTLVAKLRDYLNAKDFGVTGDGLTNDTAAINNALLAAYTAGKTLYFPSGIYRYTEASAGAGYALLNRGVSMVGDGMFRTIFTPLATMPNTADFMLLNPPSNSDISGLEFAHFFVNPKADGTVRGRRGVYMLFDVVTNLTRLHVHDVCIRDCNDSAWEGNNTIAINSQGVPAFSCFEGNVFYDRLKLAGVGDSCTIRDNVFNTPDGSGRVGIHLYHVDGGGGVSSHTMIYGNAIVCNGGALLVERGRNIKFIRNNVEQSHGGGSNQAVIDINGSGGLIPMVEIKGNHISAFGTTTVQRLIRINAANCAEIEANTLLSGIVLPEAIRIHTAAEDVYVGRNAVNTAAFTTVINDSGQRTAGMLKTFTITAAGVVAAPGYVAPAFHKDKEGTVYLKGAFSGAAIATGTVIGTLPVGYRPVGVERFAATGTVGGGPVSVAIEIDAAGAVKFITESGAAGTFGSLNNVHFTTSPIVQSTT
jgi:hypothetical protein